MTPPETETSPFAAARHAVYRTPVLRPAEHGPLRKPSRPADAALRMDLVVRWHGGVAGKSRFSASARLPLPDRDVYATAVHADLYSAITKLVERLVRRSRGRKSGPKPARRIKHASRVKSVELPEVDFPHVRVMAGPCPMVN